LLVHLYKKTNGVSTGLYCQLGCMEGTSKQHVFNMQLLVEQMDFASVQSQLCCWPVNEKSPSPSCLAYTRSRHRFPAAATDTAMGDRIRTGKPPQYFTQPPRPTQPPTLTRTGKEYQPMCGGALWLEVKGRYGSFHLWINV